MHRRRIKKKVNMKTRILRSTIGVAALAAIILNANASDVLLTPRAAGNQTKAAPGVIVAQSANPVSAISPRALGNQVKSVAGVANEVNPATLCSRHMTASPKAIQACAVNPANMPCCSK
jgi:hypothetical protein